MISATATFAVLKEQTSAGVLRVMTVLTDLADIRPYDATAPELPTYAEAVAIVTERGLARAPRIGFLKQFGVAEYVPVSERVVLDSAEELDALAAAMK
jgi:hypothetical protein